jgi:undecaprenyl diphosphate synthase
VNVVEPLAIKIILTRFSNFFIDSSSTRKNAWAVLSLVLSYGGRLEIVTAINALLREGATEISQEDFSKKLWTAGIPDPELIIRTGGEQRLSNFLPWQSVYSELFFTPTYWPEFSKEEFISILDNFAERERRQGK